MHAFVRNAASTETALSRASSQLAHGRSPAYRRLASTLPRQSARSDASSIRYGRSFTAPLSPLRSPFLPAELRLTSARAFHASTSRYQEKPPAAEPKPTDTEKKSAPESEPKPEEEAKKAAGEGEEAKKAAGEGEEAKKAAGEGEEAKKDGEEGEKKEGEDGEGKDKKKEDAPPPPPHGDKTPWQVFMETMNTEFQASKEWNESTKQLGDAAHQFSESESVRRAREAYEKSTGAMSNSAAAALKGTAGVIGKGAAWTWDTNVVKGVRKAANVTGDAVDKATKPIRETEAYRNVKNVIDDGSSSRYGGWVEKEERRKRREALQKQRGAYGKVMVEDPDAGTNVTLHKDAAWKEAWRDFRDQSKFAQSFSSMRSKYEESENPLISTARSITDRIGGFFAENETAQVIKQFRTMDPNFQTEPFLQELREYILPEVLDAYVKGDTETLKLWLSAAQYSVYEALTKQYLQAGMKSDGRILDIRNVDILRARILDPGDVPVFIITCRTQEVHVYRNAKSGELAAGMEDKVQLVTYAIGITRVPEDVNNPETRGWRLIEMQKSGRDWY